MRYYEDLLPVVGTLLICLLFLGYYPLLALIFWHLFNAAASPYPLLGALALVLGFQGFAISLLWNWHLSGIPLELYHQPRWFMAFMRFQLPHLATRLTDEALEPGARRRAAELRVLAGMELGDEEHMGRAAG